MYISKSPQRRLRHTPGTNVRLSTNGAHNFAAKHALVQYTSNSIYTFIPKNGCTTMRLSLASANGCIQDLEDWTWVHTNNATFSANLKELLCADYTFVILRCPFRRLASAFLDKIVERTPEYWDLFRQCNDSLDPTKFSFRDFLNTIGRAPRFRNNIHWRPQVQFLVYQDYDDWFSLEHFGDTAENITSNTGMQILDARNLSRHGTQSLKQAAPKNFVDWPISELEILKRDGRIPAYADLYDDETIKLTRSIYSEDLTLYSEKCAGNDLLFSAT